MKTKREGGRTREGTVKADTVLLAPHLDSILGQHHGLTSNHGPEFSRHSHLWSLKRQGGGHLWVVLVKQLHSSLSHPSHRSKR